MEGLSKCHGQNTMNIDNFEMNLQKSHFLGLEVGFFAKANYRVSFLSSRRSSLQLLPQCFPRWWQPQPFRHPALLPR